MTAEQMQDLLKEYEHEIYGAEGMYGVFDLKYLIDSHKRIRQSNLELRSSIYKTRELAHKHGLMPSVYMANMWRKSHIDDKEGVGKDYSAKHMTTVSISNTDSNQSFQCRPSPSPLNESTRVGECSGDTEVATEGDKGLNGCYVGCYYYTDSCFRKDCKQ